MKQLHNDRDHMLYYASLFGPQLNVQWEMGRRHGVC